jgi:phage host-nuclease inhibitor protein Gam
MKGKKNQSNKVLPDVAEGFYANIQLFRESFHKTENKSFNYFLKILEKLSQKKRKFSLNDLEGNINLKIKAVNTSVSHPLGADIMSLLEECRDYCGQYKDDHSGIHEARLAYFLEEGIKKILDPAQSFTTSAQRLFKGVVGEKETQKAHES